MYYNNTLSYIRGERWATSHKIWSLDISFNSWCFGHLATLSLDISYSLVVRGPNWAKVKVKYIRNFIAYWLKAQCNMMYQMGLRLFGSRQHANGSGGGGHQLTDLYVYDLNGISHWEAWISIGLFLCDVAQMLHIQKLLRFRDKSCLAVCREFHSVRRGAPGITEESHTWNTITMDNL